MGDIIKYIKTTSTSLSDLPIVNGQIIALTDIDGLYYDFDNVRHVAGSGAGSATLEGLTDVTLSSLTDGQALTYDATSEEWINATIFETISSDDFDDLPQEEKDNGTAYFIPDAGWTGGGSGGGGGGGTTYTAGDGIVIENDEISTDNASAEDMEEIITPLPGTFSRRFKYSTTEQVVGEWIDGKPLYQKTIDFGSLPSNTSKSVNHNIANIDYIVDAYGVSKDTSSNFRILPHVTQSATNSQISLVVSTTSVSIGTAINMATFTETYVTLLYTKTTD